MSDHKFMLRALALAEEKMNDNNGGPFGAVIVRHGEIISEGWNQVTSQNDPTGHAEITAIRRACEKVSAFNLPDCDIYTSCEPCPMCLGAIYWARPLKMYFACNREDAANVGFDDRLIYEEIERPIEDRRIESINFLREEGLTVFENWANKSDKTEY